MSLWAFACDFKFMAIRRFPWCGGLNVNICGNDTEEISFSFLCG